jgi:hypothetical protein
VLIIENKKTKQKHMITRRNKKNRTAFVYDSVGTFEAFVSQTFRGAKQGNRLTLRDGDDRVDIYGRELRVLRNVLNKANVLASRA